MVTSSILEKVNFLILDSTTYIFKHHNKRLVIEGVVYLMLSKNSMTCTYCNRNTLTWLLWSSVFYQKVLIWLTPSLFRKISGFKNAFVKEYQMATFLRYGIQAIVYSDSFINEFLGSLFLSGWNITDLNFSFRHSS